MNQPRRSAWLYRVTAVSMAVVAVSLAILLSSVLIAGSAWVWTALLG